MALLIRLLSHFFSLRGTNVCDDDLIQDFLWMDCCCKVGDKLTVVCVGIIRYYLRNRQLRNSEMEKRLF
ncbi:hypothetical protein NDU88_001554 [Pleurodeles waltl]|uniref:Uncharacterized protein n=1 Tax=Pleurodeles waltl TaxID=8319 RepID=A0AAV7R8B8_PLEWA|nr:hypothetical protein NDU88_001554 [Pleurodeles waltl]